MIERKHCVCVYVVMQKIFNNFMNDNKTQALTNSYITECIMNGKVLELLFFY